MQLQPYLFYEGRCEEAIEHYRQALGAEVVVKMRYDESPEPPPEGRLPPGSGDRVMHAELRIGDVHLMASDGMCSGEASFHGIHLALNVADAATVDRMSAALAEGGEVTMPPSETFWSPRFAMVEDRFGVGWMIGVTMVDEGAEGA